LLLLSGSLVEAYNQVCEQNVPQAPAQPAAHANTQKFDILALGDVVGRDPNDLSVLAAKLTGRPQTSFATDGSDESGQSLTQAITRAQQKLRQQGLRQWAKTPEPGGAPLANLR